MICISLHAGTHVRDLGARAWQATSSFLDPEGSCRARPNEIRVSGDGNEGLRRSRCRAVLGYGATQLLGDCAITAGFSGAKSEVAEKKESH